MRYKGRMLNVKSGLDCGSQYRIVSEPYSTTIGEDEYVEVVNTLTKEKKAFKVSLLENSDICEITGRVFKAEKFDEFVSQCPFSCRINTNGGRGCTHSLQSKKAVHYLNSGDEKKLCHCFSCPLGYEADQDDFDDSNIRNKIDWSAYFNEDEDKRNVEIEEGEYLIIDSDIAAIKMEHLNSDSYFRLDYDKVSQKFILYIVYHKDTAYIPESSQIIDTFSDYNSAFNRGFALGKVTAKELVVMIDALKARIDLMSEEEKEDFIQGMEAARDYGGSGDLHWAEHKTYEMIIKER